MSRPNTFWSGHETIRDAYRDAGWPDSNSMRTMLDFICLKRTHDLTNETAIECMAFVLMDENPELSDERAYAMAVEFLNTGHEINLLATDRERIFARWYGRPYYRGFVCTGMGEEPPTYPKI